MPRIALLATVAVAAGLIAGCQDGDLFRRRGKDPTGPVATAPAAPDPDRQRDRQVAARITDLACRLQPALAPVDENLAWSPVEAAASASLLLASATGRTHRELLAVIRLHSFGEWNAEFRAYRARTADPAVRSATRLWGANGAGVSGSITGDALALAGASPAALPADPATARAAHGACVAGIAADAGDVLPAGEPAPGTTLALTSATALLVQPLGLGPAGTGHWQRADGHQVPAAMLHGMVDGLAAEPPECSLVAVPLAGSRCLLVIAVPRTRDGLAALEASLTADRLRSWRRALRPRQVSLMLPRFSIQRTVDLGDAFRKLGAGLAFGDEAVFGALGPAEPGRLRLGLWRGTTAVTITGDEPAGDAADTATGAPPAAATGDGGWPVSADRPFWFAILQPDSDSWLLFGRVVEPDPAEAPQDIGHWADQVGGS